MPGIDDFASVLRAAQAGQGWAFAALFDAYGNGVAGYLRAQHTEDPEDLANEVLLRAFRKLAGFAGEEPRFRSWLFTIAHNAALDDRRRARRRPVIAGDAVPDAPEGDVVDDVLARLARERVEALLTRLAPDQRDVFLLRVLGDLSLGQTAEVLGKSYGAVKALERRGAATLKRLLSQEGVPR